MSGPLELFASCQPGLEPLLLGELSALEIEGDAQRGGVAFTGDAATVQRCGLWLGTASHLLMRITQFRCRALGELQRKVSELPWRQWLRAHVPIAVKATTRGSRVYHTSAVEERVENAIATALGKAPPKAEPGDEIVAHIHVRFREDVCTVSIDAASTPLHRRGYRLDGRKAPLREDLAHALVLASGWQPGEALLDPFCGSGTIVIEAAAIAQGLPPGRLRAPALQHLALFDSRGWEKTFKERRPAIASLLAGGDRDAGAIEASKANAERAGVAAAITLHEGAVTTHPWLQAAGAPERGVLVTNPPFGVRVSDAAKLVPLYQTLGHRAARLGAAWRVAVLANDVRLCRRTGLVLTTAFTSKHGGLQVAAMVGSTALAERAGR